MAFRIPREARSTRTVGNRSGIPVGARFVRGLHLHADAICEPPWRVCEQHAARRSRYGVAKDHALADFRRRLKVLDAICADGGPGRDTKQPSCAQRSLDAGGLVRAVGRQVGTMDRDCVPRRVGDDRQYSRMQLAVALSSTRGIETLVRRQGGYALSTEFATIKLVDGPHKKDVGQLHQRHREGENKQPVGDGRI